MSRANYAVRRADREETAHLVQPDHLERQVLARVRRRAADRRSPTAASTVRRRHSSCLIISLPPRAGTEINLSTPRCRPGRTTTSTCGYIEPDTSSAPMCGSGAGTRRRSSRGCGRHPRSIARASMSASDGDGAVWGALLLIAKRRCRCRGSQETDSSRSRIVAPASSIIERAQLVDQRADDLNPVARRLRPAGRQRVPDLKPVAIDD